MGFNSGFKVLKAIVFSVSKIIHMVPKTFKLKYQEYGRKSECEIGGSECADSECYYILRCDAV